MLNLKTLYCRTFIVTFSLTYSSLAEPFQLPISTLQSNKLGALKVVTKETRGALVPNARFKIRGRNFNKDFKTDEKGEVVIELPEGWYSLAVNTSYYFPTARPLFKISSGANTNFELMLFPLVIVEPNEGQKLDPSIIVEYLTEKIKLQSISKREFGLIQYGEKVVNRKFQTKIQYLGFTHRFLHNPGERERYFPAVLMSNLLTISARKITLDRKSGIVVAEDDVTLRDGQAARTLKSLVINIKQGKILKEAK